MRTTNKRVDDDVTTFICATCKEEKLKDDFYWKVCSFKTMAPEIRHVKDCKACMHDKYLQNRMPFVPKPVKRLAALTDEQREDLRKDITFLSGRGAYNRHKEVLDISFSSFNAWKNKGYFSTM